jgi:hypothetical protein
MASNSRNTVRTLLQVFLALVIAGLAYYLYYSITAPYEVIERQREMTQLTRERMTQIRTAMVHHNEVRDGYPHSLDSLVEFVKTDSLLVNARDSVFGISEGSEFNPDSLPYSPRTGNRFVLEVNDTLETPTYVLRDPDSGDSIGTVTPDITELNAASWE